MENTELAKQSESMLPDWLLNMDWDEYEKLAAIGYPPEKIAMYYKINKLEFMYYYMTPEGELEYHYQRGQLVEQAKGGLTMLKDSEKNITQLQRLDKLKNEIEFTNARDKIIYGGI